MTQTSEPVDPLPLRVYDGELDDPAIFHEAIETDPVEPFIDLSVNSGASVTDLNEYRDARRLAIWSDIDLDAAIDKQEEQEFWGDRRIPLLIGGGALMGAVTGAYGLYELYRRITGR